MASTAPAKWLDPITSTVHTDDSTVTKNKDLRVGSFLERFLDRVKKLKEDESDEEARYQARWFRLSKSPRALRT